MKSWFFVFILSLTILSLSAQDEDSINYSNDEWDYETEDTTVEASHVIIPPENLESLKSYKEEKVSLKKFDKATWKKVIGETDYTEEKPEEKESKKPKLTKPSGPWNSFILSIVVYALVGGLVIFLLYQISKNISLSDIKIRKKLVAVDNYEAPVENIGELDVQQLLQQALSAANFRLAVRIYYLGLLKKLDEVEIIIWKKNKTNRDYLIELFSKDFFYDEINRLTILYEQVWYGEYTLNQEKYELLASNFEMMNQKITTKKSS